MVYIYVFFFKIVLIDLLEIPDSRLNCLNEVLDLRQSIQEQPVLHYYCQQSDMNSFLMVFVYVDIGRQVHHMFSSKPDHILHKE